MDEQEIINLKEVYKELTKKSIFRSKRKTALLNNFAHLLAEKSSFAHKVHKDFGNFVNMPTE